MSEITLSKAVRSNLLNLQSTAAQLGKTQERLATGQRVNSALDNPTNFFTASSLNSRASDMSQLLDSMSNGIQTIEAADNGLTAITKTLESMQSTLTQARQDKSFKATSYDISSTATGNLSFSGGAVGTTAVDVALASGTSSPTAGTNSITFGSSLDFNTPAATAGTATATYAASNTTFNPAAAATAAQYSFAFVSDTTAYGGTDTSTFDIDVDGAGAAQTIQITQGAVQAVGNFDSSIDSIAEFTQILQNLFTAAGGNAAALTVANDGSNITITSSTTGAASNVTITGATGDEDAGGATNTLQGLGNANVSGTAATAADSFSFAIDVDGAGAAQTITVDQSIVAGVGNNDNVIDSITELTAAVNAALQAAGGNAAAVTVTDDGSALTFTSGTTGTGSIVAISAVTPDADGGGNANTTYGIANTPGTAGTGAAAPTLTFDVTVDGGTTQNITINAAAVAAAGNNDNVIDDADELATILNNLTTGLTAANNAGTITLTSDTTGTSSSVVIANTTATGVTNTSGISDGVGTSGAATGGPALATVDQLVDTINTNTSLNTAVRASNDNGKLRIENLSTQDLTLTGYNSTSTNIDGGTGTTTIGGNTARSDLATQYNTLRDQLDKISDDASFNGVNLLRGDKLQITFNETSTSEIAIQAKGGLAVNSANLGIQTSLSSANLDSDANIDGYISLVKTALGSVRSQASAFGSNLSVVQNRQDFTKNMINTLQTGASNLTLADSNEEAANLLALQTRQQLSSTALSLASQSDQNVLRLF